MKRRLLAPWCQLFFTGYRLDAVCRFLTGWACGLFLSVATAGPVDPPWQVAVHAGTASVRITGADGSIRQVPLRADLLPKVHYLPGGDAALLASRSGWVFRLDLKQACVVGQVRVSEVLTDTALSAPQTGLPVVLAVVKAVPPTLVFLNAQLQLLRQLPVTDQSGQHASDVLGIRVAQSRDSFVVALKSLPELWEISYNPTAPEIARGMVHDFQYREGSFMPGYLNPQRSTLASPSTDFQLSADGHEVLTLHTNPATRHLSDAVPVTVMHLDVRRKVAEWRLPAGSSLHQLVKVAE